MERRRSNSIFLTSDGESTDMQLLAPVFQRCDVCTYRLVLYGWNQSRWGGRPAEWGEEDRFLSSFPGYRPLSAKELLRRDPMVSWPLQLDSCYAVREDAEPTSASGLTPECHLPKEWTYLICSHHPGRKHGSLHRSCCRLPVWLPSQG